MDTRTGPTTPRDSADARASIALRAALTMLLPLARWLLRNGVHYASFAPALKQVFVDAARLELAATGAKITDSSVSLLSGVHRRDLRDSRAKAAAGAEGENGTARVKTPSVVSQAFTRWVTDAEYRDRRNRPMALPRSGPAPSFDSLARQVSSDVHPRTLLAEMQRLDLLEEEGEGMDARVKLRVQAFLPQQGFDGDAAIFSANVADHIAAAAHNVGAAAEGRFLEQSMYGSGLTAQSVAALGDTARALWGAAFEQIVREATRRYEQDRELPDAQMRMRFGVYYYAEPVATSATQDGPEAPAR